jgi:hypothetical protein
MLCADWFMQLGNELGFPFSQYGASDYSYTVGSPNDFHVIAHFTETEPYLRFVSSDTSRQQEIDSLANQAESRIKQGNFGATVWYSATCSAPDYQISAPYTMGSMLERLSNQIRIVGWRRLGSSVLIAFEEELSSVWDPKNALFAPKALALVHLAVSAPCVGNFSSYVAHAALETIAAICAVALGRGVSLPPSVFPTRPEVVPELQTRQLDQSVLTLARKHVALDIFTLPDVPGGLECFQRLRSAFLTFDAAKQQEHDAVACVLYVVAAECLTTLNTPWRDSKLTKRFVDFFDLIMADELDQMVSHDGFEEIFGIRRGTRTAPALRRNMLEQIYEYRSGNLHAGLSPNYRGFTSVFNASESIRRALFADFAEGAILRYLHSPRSSIVGHPMYSKPT